MAAPAGVVLYDGPSRLDGKRILAIATGIHRISRNAKKGDPMTTRTEQQVTDAILAGFDPTLSPGQAAASILRALDTAGFKVVRKPRAAGSPRGKAASVAASARLDAIHGTPFDRMRGR